MTGAVFVLRSLESQLDYEDSIVKVEFNETLFTNLSWVLEINDKLFFQNFLFGSQPLLIP